MRDHLLLITKHFLDSRDAQAQQSAALASALSEAGATVEVITGAVDPYILSASVNPALKVHALPAHWPTRSQTLTGKITRKIDRNLSAWRPTHWARRAAHLASKLMAEKRYSALISIALPMESHIAARHAKRSAPWIACLSDPWPESILPKPYADFAIPLLTDLQKLVVADVFASADALVLPCEEELKFLASIYGLLHKSKTLIIPHIAPSLEAIVAPAKEETAEITVVHGGSLSRERVCPGLAEAFAALPASSRLRIHFIGQTHPNMLQAFNRAGAMERVMVDGWKNKQETLSILMQARALLLVEAPMSTYPFLPSKLADYSATGRPIIAITGSSSPSARLVLENRAGCVSGYDRESILSALQWMESEFVNISSANLSAHFSPKNVTAKYCSLIEELGRGRAGKSKTTVGLSRT